MPTSPTGRPRPCPRFQGSFSLHRISLKGLKVRRNKENAWKRIFCPFLLGYGSNHPMSIRLSVARCCFVSNRAPVPCISKDHFHNVASSLKDPTVNGPAQKFHHPGDGNSQHLQGGPSAGGLGYVGISSVSYRDYPETELMPT